MIFHCSGCNKNHAKKKNDKDLNKRFAKAYKFTSLPDKKEFYGNLNIEDITNADCKHAKRAWKDFKIKNLGQYDDL